MFKSTKALHHDRNFLIKEFEPSSFTRRIIVPTKPPILIALPLPSFVLSGTSIAN